jgi:hypothetical protein
MVEKSEIETLRAEARNCRKLAEMTVDEAARQYLLRIAARYDEQREHLEAFKAELAKQVAARATDDPEDLEFVDPDAVAAA